MSPHSASDRQRDATRVDGQTQTTETVGFHGDADHQLISTTYAPKGGAETGVVICSSICNDFLNNYRREVELARELAAKGIAVARFHYRGLGNSDGDEATVTFDAMIDDAREAAEHLRASTGISRIAFLGTRFGAPIAAALASDEPDAPLVLADPTLEASKFFREAWRAASITKLAKDGKTGATSKELVDELRANGVVDVLGHEIHLRLYESSMNRTLLGELTDRHRPVLVLQFGRTARADIEAAVTTLREAGASVDVELLGKPQLWWVIEEEERPVDDFVPTVTGWPPLHANAAATPTGTHT